MSDHHIKAGLDVLALVTVVGSWTEYLSPIAAALGGVWYAIQIFDWIVTKIVVNRISDKQQIVVADKESIVVATVPKEEKKDK